jgi:hypothetical protein
LSGNPAIASFRASTSQTVCCAKLWPVARSLKRHDAHALFRASSNLYASATFSAEHIERKTQTKSANTNLWFQETLKNFAILHEVCRLFHLLAQSRLKIAAPPQVQCTACQQPHETKTHDYLKHSGDVAWFPNGSQNAYYWSSLSDETKIRASCGKVAARCLLEHVLSNASLVREVSIRPFLSTLSRLDQLKLETVSLPDFTAYNFDHTSWLSPVYPVTSQSCALLRTYN